MVPLVQNELSSVKQFLITFLACLIFLRAVANAACG